MKYQVRSPLNHDNTVYEIGSIVELAEKTGSGLLEIGVLSTIVEEGNETASSAEAAQDSGAAQEETTKTVKKSGKGAVVNE
ncbi:MAG: hypothetical protein WCQ26_11660 [Pseudanabaena sp. ELA748]